MPVLSQVSENPPQDDHPLYVVDPHPSPSVSREHERVCGLVEPPQVPAPQVYVVTLRDWVPVSSQTPEKLPHDDHAVAAVSSQVVPSVSREQAPDSVDVVEPHDPASQVYTVRVRDRVPDSSQTSA